MHMLGHEDEREKVKLLGGQGVVDATGVPGTQYLRGVPGTQYLTIDTS